MFKKNLRLTLIIFVVFLTGNTFGDADYHNVKKELEKKIENEMKELKKGLREGLKMPEKPSGGPFDFSPSKMKKMFRERNSRLKNLLKYVRKSPAEELPSSMVNLFIQEESHYSGRYPRLRSFILILGESAVQPFINNYEKVNDHIKERILIFLGWLESGNALSLIRKAIKEKNTRISIAAISSLRLILGPQSTEELNHILRDEEDPAVIKHIFKELAFLKDPLRYDTFLTFVREGKIELVSMENLRECPEDTIGKNIPLILSKIEGTNHQEHFVAIQLIVKLGKPLYLKQLFPILSDLLHVQFQYGGIVKNHQSYASHLKESAWTLWKKEVEHLIKRIESNLKEEDISEWLQNDFQSLLPRLYLEDLLSQKKGDVFNLKEEKFSFQISVIDQKDHILASATYPLSLGKEVVLEIGAKISEYPQHSLTVKLLLDRSKWWFRMDPIVIDLKPYGVGFPADIPFSGAYEIKLNETFRGRKETVIWRFEHIE